MIQTGWFGRGFRLRAAITIACQLAFVLFGYDQVGSYGCGLICVDWLHAHRLDLASDAS